MSKKALKNGHAEHIHPNCDCTYAVRFDGKSNVEGYDPEKYLDMYYEADGSTPQERINAMRRMQYAAHPEKYREQNRKSHFGTKQRNHRGRGYDVLRQYLDDATPGRGLFDYETGYSKKDHDDEIKTAQIIFKKLGGNIVLKAEKDGQKNPDYEWMGALWDLKSTTTEKAANSAIKSGMKQIRTKPGGIILNFGDNSFEIEELIKVIDMRMQWYPKDSADVMIISNGEIIKVLRY